MCAIGSGVEVEPLVVTCANLRCAPSACLVPPCRALGVKDDLPPVIRDSRNPWLGDKPSL